MTLLGKKAKAAPKMREMRGMPEPASMPNMPKMPDMARFMARHDSRSEARRKMRKG